MSYETPAALRAALEARLVNASHATGTDLDRLRRRVVFERILARLAMATGERWILKGGFALEVRLGDRARATRDLDVALGQPTEDGADVRDALIDTLATAAGDDFTFAVAASRRSSRTRRVDLGGGSVSQRRSQAGSFSASASMSWPGQRRSPGAPNTSGCRRPWTSQDSTMCRSKRSIAASTSPRSSTP